VNAIPTRYAGHLFRSRLEARWAAMFDLLGWQWTYEPFDLEGYIPDFLVANPLDASKPLLVEIKEIPDVTHARRIIAAGWSGSFVVLGAQIQPGLISDGRAVDGCDDDAGFIRCVGCGVGTNSYEQSYQCRRCGTHDGDGHFWRMDDAELRPLWGRAHELTRWLPQVAA
jgi:hypothetical protein